jgi:hypothetical protein
MEDVEHKVPDEVTVPNSIKIGPYRYQVKVTSLDPFGAGDINYGITQREHQVILLEEEQADDAMADSLLHEVLHAIIFVSGYNEMNNDEEEDLVARISPFLLSVIRDNRAFIRFLMGR